MEAVTQTGNASATPEALSCPETASCLRIKILAWLPLALVSPSVLFVLSSRPAWLQMWGLAVAIYGGLKWLSYAIGPPPKTSNIALTTGYLLLWPGMDARSFLANCRILSHPRMSEWVAAGAKAFSGLVLVFTAVYFADPYPSVSAWVGMWGIVLLLHFGMFHLLSLCWRNAGIAAPPIMNIPLLSVSLSDFWGRRWNLAFRDLSYRFLFCPTVGRLGVVGATLFVFLISGIIHDVVISIPAGAGFGLPTLYFVIQACGLLLERSRLGISCGLKNGLIGRLYCLLFTVAPLGLLFHRPFIERVVLPMLAAWKL